MELLHPKVSDIIVSEARHRKGLGDDDKKAKVAFEDLKRSITERKTLLNPIRVVSRDDLTLVAGYRRLQVAKELGWETIPTTVDGAEMTPLERELLELDENIQRFDLSWHEREQAIARINTLRTESDPTWTQKRTADQLGITQGKVSEADMLSKMMELFPEIKKADTRKSALSMAKHKAKTTLRRVEIKSNPEVYKSVTEKVVCARVEDFIKALPDGAAGRLILTDPPFGIDYDKKPAGDGAHEAYSDSPEAYRKMVLEIAPHLYRVLLKDGFLVWFLAHDHFEFCKKVFKDVGFLVDPVPLVWNRSKGKTYSVRPDRWFGKGYDIALHCIKGNPELIVRSREGGNVFSYTPVSSADKEHIVERPLPLYTEIIRCMTLPGERVSDFFGGSGSVAASAASIGRDHLTVEVNPAHIPTIVKKIFANTAQEAPAPAALAIVT